MRNEYIYDALLPQLYSVKSVLFSLFYSVLIVVYTL